ncbi:hypothetical protein [Bacillus sp. FJAT-27264]|uniref:hypothetical protein n=1 Tax=Paenibacillus sp. (strain DSM 101736 / FJAT-27264) TaxID=1850362 RepID=UPI0011121D3C|nr:hypothetical protein [Bacillus sp. FJAT-27264]
MNITYRSSLHRFIENAFQKRFCSRKIVVPLQNGTIVPGEDPAILRILGYTEVDKEISSQRVVVGYLPYMCLIAVVLTV